MVFAGKTVEDGVDLYPSFEINFAGIKRFKIKMAANCETIFLIISSLFQRRARNRNVNEEQK